MREKLLYRVALVLILLILLACYMPGTAEYRNRPTATPNFATQLYLSTLTPYVSGTPSPLPGTPAAPGAPTAPHLLPTNTGAPAQYPTMLPTTALTRNWPGGAPAGKIVYTCYIQGYDQICLINADGSNPRQLTDVKATNFYASLSPDGQEVVFSSNRSGRFEIYSVDIHGNNLTKLTNNIGSLYAPEISPDGKTIVFTNHVNNRQSLWVMDRDGSNPHILTSGNLSEIDGSWSSDGSELAFVSDRSGSNQLYTMDSNGGSAFQVTNLGDMGGRNDWSPDGSQLTFYAGPGKPTWDRNIYVINANGTGMTKLTNGGDNLGPTWSPDGNWIAFTTIRTGNNEIFIMRPDGTGLVNLTSNTRSDWQPRWGP